MGRTKARPDGGRPEPTTAVASDPQGDAAAALDGAAGSILARRDRRMRALIARIGPYEPDRTRDPFLALFASILHQQISMSAARSIQRRVRALLPRRRVTPRALLALPDAQLRSAGVSPQKLGYLRSLAEHFASGKITAARLRRMPDDEVIETVTDVKGIGRWTAEMLLLFCLERPDIWPVDDLGLRKGLQRFYGLAEPPSAKEALAMGEPWRPYRSVATWYLWRSLENPVQPSLNS